MGARPPAAARTPRRWIRRAENRGRRYPRCGQGGRDRLRHDNTPVGAEVKPVGVVWWALTVRGVSGVEFCRDLLAESLGSGGTRGSRQWHRWRRGAGDVAVDPVVVASCSRSRTRSWSADSCSRSRSARPWTTPVSSTPASPRDPSMGMSSGVPPRPCGSLTQPRRRRRHRPVRAWRARPQRAGRGQDAREDRAHEAGPRPRPARILSIVHHGPGHPRHGERVHDREARRAANTVIDVRLKRIVFAPSGRESRRATRRQQPSARPSTRPLARS